MTQLATTLPNVKLSTWSPEKSQSVAATLLGSHWLTVLGFLSNRFGPEASREYMAAHAKSYAKQLKAEGLKTPLEIARRLAEDAKNILGSTIEIRGETNHAQVECQNCGCGAAMGKLAEANGVDLSAVMCGSKAQGEKSEGPIAWFSTVAGEFGFKLHGELIPPTGYRFNIKG